MSNNKKLPFQPDFDPTVPEEGVVVPEDIDTGELFGNHLPSADDIAIAARESFGNTLPEDLIQELVRSSTEVNESVRRILHEHMNLGFRFGEIMRNVHRAYLANFGDNQRTLQRAKSAAFAYIEKLHRISNSKVRMHLRAYAKFHSNMAAVEFLSQTDMQLLLGKDLGDDIVNAVIEKRKENPDMPSREVKDLIAAYRQKQDELTATQEQVESVNNEMAKLITLYDVSKAEERRLHREMEQMQLQQSETQEAMGRLRNDLALAGNSRNALHQQLSEIEKERDAARREVAELKDRPPVREEDAQAKADRRRVEDQFARLLKESQQLEDKIEAQKVEEAAIAAKVQKAEAGLEARYRLDEQINALVIDFGEFAQRYHSVQLLCTAEGRPERYKPIFDALADVVGKFHKEIEAASKAA